MDEASLKKLIPFLLVLFEKLNKSCEDHDYIAIWKNEIQDAKNELKLNQEKIKTILNQYKMLNFEVEKMRKQMLNEYNNLDSIKFHYDALMQSNHSFKAEKITSNIQVFHLAMEENKKSS